MHSRYPAPRAEEMFGRQTQIDLWQAITIQYAEARADFHNGTIAPDDEEQIDLRDLHQWLVDVPKIDELAVATREQIVGHEVVAFIGLFEEQMPEHYRWLIHLGLTSSDLVENATITVMQAHSAVMRGFVLALMEILASFEAQDTRRAGRTHGQLAAPTSWSHQFRVLHSSLKRLDHDFLEWHRHCGLKSPGPTGRPMDGALRPISSRVASLRGFSGTIPSTQVIQRDLHVSWASLYVRLAGVMENLAVLVRLGARSEVGEVREGQRRVGSSAMPAKKNPISFEKVSGLSHLARGYFAAISSNTALWEDRDLTNSALERVAFADLAAVVEHMAYTSVKTMGGLRFDFKRATETMLTWEVWTHEMQVQMQKRLKFGPTQSSTVIRQATSGMRPGETGFRSTSKATHLVYCELLRMGVTVEDAGNWHDAVMNVYQQTVAPMADF